MSTTPPKPDSTVEDSIAAGSLTTADAVADLIDLPSGSELDDVAAAKLRASEQVRLVVIAGPVMCGKTTLLASLYELFQWGKVSGYSFAGSSTLPAFERRCYHSRAASERSVPDTERTPIDKARYLHLQVWKRDFERPLDLLFTDVSGETFERASDSITECKQLHFLRLADHFLLLLDSEKLANKNKRWQVAHESMTLLRSCLDSGMLDHTSLVNVVFAKFDYLQANQSEEQTQFLSKIKDEFENEFKSRVARLTFSQIAARPMEVTTFKFGHGISDLLTDWVSIAPRENLMNILPDITMGCRESELFASRHFRAVLDSQ